VVGAKLQQVEEISEHHDALLFVDDAAELAGRSGFLRSRRSTNSC